MKIFLNLVIVILTFLALSSGVTKVLLMQQEIEFFGGSGFTNPIIVSFGIVQILGGVLLAIQRTRILGSAVVAVTFLISAVLLAKAGNIPVAVVTTVCIALLGLVIQQSNSRNVARTDTIDT